LGRKTISTEIMLCERLNTRVFRNQIPNI